METEVLGRMVPVVDGPRSIVTFTGGAHGSQEAGRYAFWVAIVDSAKGRGIVGRGSEDGDPGERFNRHPDDPAYAASRAQLAACEHVMPATAKMIEHWFDSHRKDAAYATEASIGGVQFRVVDFKLVSV